MQLAEIATKSLSQRVANSRKMSQRVANHDKKRFLKFFQSKNFESFYVFFATMIYNTCRKELQKVAFELHI